MPIECPKCGRAVEAEAFICPGCDFILDASFLGDDITDDERDKRPSEKPKKAAANVAARVDFGEDAMILGNVDDQEVSSFNSRDAGVHQREVTQARFYIGGAIAQLMQPDAIPEAAGGLQGASIRMTPFERHVLTFVNGKRSIARIQKKSAMDESEFKTALAMLADKGFIKLRGYKKPKAGSSSGLGSQISQVVARAGTNVSGPVKRAEPEPERTVVASMEHIEAQARAEQAAKAKKAATLARSPHSLVEEEPRRSAPVAEAASHPDTPVVPRAQDPAPTRVAADPRAQRVVGPKTAGPTVTAPNATAPGADALPAQSRRFASLKADLPESDGESAPARVPPIDDEVDPLKAAASAAWDAAANQSSVFADSGPSEAAPANKGPAQSPLPAPDVDDEANGFDYNAPTGGFSALKDPTGIGDSLMSGDEAGADGAPIDDDDEDDAEADDDRRDDDGADEDEPEEQPPYAADDGDEPRSFASAEQIPSVEDTAALGQARRIHEEVTAPPRPVPRPLSLVVLVDPDAQGDDADEVDAPTRQLPAARPMTLPSEALSPVVVEPPAPVAPPAAPAPAVVAPPMIALPGQGIAPAARVQAPVVSAPMSPAAPAPAAPAPAAPAPAAPAPAPAPQMGLPGQVLGKVAIASVPASAVKPAAPTRVSAASQVPFELRKKAEKIYEQALRDQAEGRLSSAMMNAKLATNFDPTVDAYRELFEQLSKKGPAQKAGPRPQELVLFEQANEAEGRGEYPKAVTLLEQAIAINPKAAALHNKIGVLLSIRLKRHNEALAHLKQAIELEPGSIVYMNNFSKVTGLLESMIQKDPKREKKRGDAKGDEKVSVKVRPRKF